MSNSDSEKLLAQWFESRVKQAGEIRHIKDNSGDASSWAYNFHGEMERDRVDGSARDAREAKILARALRASMMALGHALDAQNAFASMKSRRVSPDGKLGGRGYIMKIPTMRKQYFNIVEVLSSLVDTLYDEVTAPHWAEASRSPEIRSIIEHAEMIRDDPESWARQEAEEDEEQRVEGVEDE